MDMHKQMMWQFETAQFAVKAYMADDPDFDAGDFDDDGETAEKLSTGEYVVFGTIVEVTHKPTGIIVGRDSLWGSVYSNPREFFEAHRSADPMNRNCSLMRAARGDISICHYFPDMVSTAIADARANVGKLCKAGV